MASCFLPLHPPRPLRPPPCWMCIAWRFSVTPTFTLYLLDSTQVKLRQLYFQICSAIMTMGFSFTLGTLLGWHIYLITRNKTTIEVNCLYDELMCQINTKYIFGYCKLHSWHPTLASITNQYEQNGWLENLGRTIIILSMLVFTKILLWYLPISCLFCLDFKSLILAIKYISLFSLRWWHIIFMSVRYWDQTCWNGYSPLQWVI